MENYTGIDIVHEYSIEGSIYIDHGFVVLKDSSSTRRVPLNDLRGYKGTKTIDELESLSGMAVNDVYAVTDSGTLVNADGSVLVIAPGDLVQYNGSKWNLLIRLVNYVPFEKFKSTVEMLTAAIASAFADEHAYTREHIEETCDTGNPHNVKVLADAIEAETAAREASILRIAPPSAAGAGEVIFYRGNLV